MALPGMQYLGPRVFAFFLKLAALGLEVSFTAQARPGSSVGPWHVFGNSGNAA